MPIIQKIPFQKLKILYIAGSGRSGSTLLEKILGSIDGINAMGEVSFIWDRGFNKNLLCGCGKRFLECDTWREIRLNAFDGEDKIDIDWLSEETQFIERYRRLPLFLFSHYFSRFKKSIELCCGFFLKIYLGASKTYKSKVLIDSSKRLHGYVLENIPEIKLYVLHLVRDARATAYSWARKKEYQKDKEKVIYFPRFNAFFASILWCFDNLSAEILGIHSKRYMRVRYEDLVSDPKGIVNRILSFVEEPQLSLPQFKGSIVHLTGQHSVAGNPVRFKQGEIMIERSSEWEKGNSIKTKFAVALIAWPFLLRYGYYNTSNRPEGQSSTGLPVGE